MKKIWRILKLHIEKDFHPAVYGMTGIFLLVALILNYLFDFEDSYLDQLHGYTKFFGYFIFYSIAYFTAVHISVTGRKSQAIYFEVDFWMKSLFGLTVLSLDASVPFLYRWVAAATPVPVEFWAYKVSINVISFFTVFLPVLCYYFLYDRKQQDAFGLSLRKFDARPYLGMLLIMLPLIVAASFNDAFLRQYPMYKSSSAHLHLGVPEWITVIIYELVYGLDFITVEYLFRGFFVLGMASVLGRSSVLPMAVLYCFLHFGKPAGETISSVMGGFLLGAVAYETRSIWGGVIAHMGIAWMMEITAYLKKIL